jgi:hypothetical protein
LLRGKGNNKKLLGGKKTEILQQRFPAADPHFPTLAAKKAIGTGIFL